MTPERWQQVKSTLAEALEQDDTAARVTLLDERCEGDTELRREVVSLLDQRDDLFSSYAESGGLLQRLNTGNADAGRRIGAYELVRELGRGGMGAVWLARRADREFEKEVAIKLLKRGTDTDEVLRRFRAEREILARLEHPNIARLLDGGTAEEALPYFVMEYVDGARVIDYVRARQPGLKQRLRLFLKICSAVELAHQNLVVHRDLKPGNILVTADGEPKLLDFGIAKLLGASGEGWEMTMAGRERLTPGYASPEQVRGEPVTTVSDVYALGAILYEMLAEQPAHRFGDSQPTATEILRVVCDEEPVRPSLAAVGPEMRRSLRGDLDTIVLRALAKVPERRYRGAGSLADDVRRYLDGRPVRARPDTVRYRTAKFIGRNKTAVTAGVLLLASLVAGVGATLWQARRADRRFEEVRKIANSFLFEFHDVIRDLPGALEARQLVTRRAVEYLDSLAAEAGSDSSLRSELAVAYDRVGDITFDTHQAIAVHRKAAALNEGLVAAEPANTAHRLRLSDSYNHLSNCERVAGHSDLSLAYARKAVAVAEGLATAHPGEAQFRDDVAQHYFTLAFNLIDAGDPAPAAEIALRAVEMQERALREDPSSPTTRHTLQLNWSAASYAFEELGDHARAAEFSRKHMEWAQAAFEAAPSNARTRRNLWSSHLRTGRQLIATGEHTRAMEHLSKAVELMEGLSAADPNDDGHRRWLAVTLTTKADLHALAGDPAIAVTLHRRAGDLAEQLLTADQGRVETRRDLARIYYSLGLLLNRSSEREPASEYFSKALALAETSLREDPTNTRVRSRFADVCAALGEFHRVDPARRAVALEWYQRSAQAWEQIAREKKLSSADVSKPSAVARAIAELENETAAPR